MKAMWVTIGGLLLVSSGAAMILPGSGPDDGGGDRLDSFLTTPKGNPISPDARGALSGTRFDQNLGGSPSSVTGAVTPNRPTSAMRTDSVRTSPIDRPPTNRPRTNNSRNTNTTTSGTEYRSTRERNMERQRIIEQRQREMEARRAEMKRSEMAAKREAQARARLGSTSPAGPVRSGVDLARVSAEGTSTTTGSAASTGGSSGSGNAGGGTNTGGGSNSGGTGGSNAGSGGGSNSGGSSGGGRGNSGSGGGGNSSAGGGGGGSTSGSNTLNGRAVWLSVDNSSCEDLEGYRTADLYIRLTQSSSVLTIQSRPTTGLKIENGSFAQHPNGTNARPADAQIVADPCIAFDSYLTINDAGIVFTPPEPGVLDWGSTLVGNWFTLGATPTMQDPAKFGDQGHYVQVARITAPAGETRVGGTLIVSVRGNTGAAVSNLTVNIFNEPSLWDGTPPTTRPFANAGNNNGGGGAGDGDGGDGDDDGNGGDNGGDGGSGDGGSDGDGGSGDDGGDNGGGDDGGDNSGGDDGGDTGGGDDNNDDDGDPPVDPDNCPVWPDPYFDDIQGVTAVWVKVDNTENGCDALDGFKTADLYLRMGAPNRVFTVTSDQNPSHNDSGLVFTGPSPLQLAGGANFQIPESALGDEPCLAYDSWLMIGNVIPSFINAPNSSNWGDRLDTIWFTTATEIAAQMPDLFDDCAYYLRVARLTITQGPTSGAEGELRIGFSAPGSSMSQSVFVDIPDCQDCFADDPAP